MIGAEARAARRAGGRREPAPLPEWVAGYVDTLVDCAARVTDEQLAGLRRDMSDEASFDVTMAASIGAMAGRIERAWTIGAPA